MAFLGASKIMRDAGRCSVHTQNVGSARLNRLGRYLTDGSLLPERMGTGLPAFSSRKTIYVRLIEVESDMDSEDV